MGLGDRVTGTSCGDAWLSGVADLGFSCMQIYSLLSGTGSSDHTGSSKSTIRSSTSSESSSASESSSLHGGHLFKR